MEKKPNLCMFCGKDESFGKMSMEHFVPRALWDHARPNMTRTVAAHEKCNNKHAADNEYFRDVLASEASAADHPEVIKLHQGSMKRKMEKQPRRMVKTFKGLRLRPVISPGGLYLGKHPVFDVDGERINQVLRNVMKGIFCSVRGVPMPQDFVFGIYADPKFVMQRFKPVIDAMPANWSSFGDDVFTCRYVFDEKKGVAMASLMRFYMNRVFFGFAHPADMSKYLAAEEERLLIKRS